MDDFNVIKIAENYIFQARSIIDYNEAYLFGSRINGTFNNESDIDIAFIINNDIETEEYFKIINKLYLLTESLNILIEPHIIIKTNDNSDFIKEVYKTGRKIA